MQKSSAKLRNELMNNPCPICGQPMQVIPDASGVTVKCMASAETCPCPENPYGHGKNEKEAHEIACQKYRKS